MIARITILTPFLLLLTGCVLGTGPQQLERERGHYNEIVRLTEDEQLLSNIVRLRYNDTPFFLDLSSVVVQYEIGAQANAGLAAGISGILGGPPGENIGSIGAGGRYSERPTVSYAPLQGENYARRMLTAIPLEVLWLLSNSGWSIERLMVLTMERLQRVDNAPTASGPHPTRAPRFENFRELAVIARRLQQNQVLTLTTSATEEDESPALVLRFDPEAMPGSEADIERFLSLLDFPVDTDSLTLSVSAADAGEEGHATVRTRSLLGVLYFIANTIEAPAEHAELGLARVAATDAGETFDWQTIADGIIEIRHSEAPPEHAFVSVFYRDHWFYIDDRDADSKATFGLLQLLFSLQSTTGSGFLPLLTLPAG